MIQLTTIQELGTNSLNRWSNSGLLSAAAAAATIEAREVELNRHRTDVTVRRIKGNDDLVAGITFICSATPPKLDAVAIMVLTAQPLCERTPLRQHDTLLERVGSRQCNPDLTRHMPLVRAPRMREGFSRPDIHIFERVTAVCTFTDLPVCPHHPSRYQLQLFCRDLAAAIA